MYLTVGLLYESVIHDQYSLFLNAKSKGIRKCCCNRLELHNLYLLFYSILAQRPEPLADDQLHLDVSQFLLTFTFSKRQTVLGWCLLCIVR